MNSAIENLEEHKKKFNEKLLNIKKEQNEKSENMKKLWKNRSQIISQYKSPFFKNIKDEENKIKENFFNEIIQKKLNYKKMKIYSKKKIPEIKIIKKENEEKTIKNKNKKNSYEENKKKNITIKNKLNHCCCSNNIELNTSLKIKEILNEKPKKKKIPMILNLSKKKNILDLSQSNINYLNDLREKKIIYSKNIDIKKLGNVKEVNFENLRKLKFNLDNINLQTKNEKELIKIKGGYNNNPNAAYKINNLEIDSIKNKMEIMYMLKKQY